VGVLVDGGASSKLAEEPCTASEVSLTRSSKKSVFSSPIDSMAALSSHKNTLMMD
jgi:hypothetical protein